MRDCGGDVIEGLAGLRLDATGNDLAVLTEADLTRANLTRADLIRANLVLADLSGADFANADLTEMYRRPGTSKAEMKGATGLDTAKGLVP